MNKKISLIFILTISVLLLNIGIASAYRSPSCNNPYSPIQKSYFTEANFIDPWGNQVVVLKKYNRPHYLRTNVGCFTYLKGFITYRSPYSYHYKNVKFMPFYSTPYSCPPDYRCY